MKDYTHQDRMGSTTNLTDQFGRVVGRADYNEWGQITYKDALDITSSYRRIYPQLSYTGHDWDDVLGMYYAKARFYDADTKRFVAIDPIKGSVTDPLSLVPYIYCVDNPLRWVDPLGMVSDYLTGDGSMPSNVPYGAALQVPKNDDNGATEIYAGTAYGNYKVGTPVEPYWLDWQIEDYPFDPNAKATEEDIASWNEWGDMLFKASAFNIIPKPFRGAAVGLAAKVLGPEAIEETKDRMDADLTDALRFYEHYRSAKGTAQTVDLGKAYREDPSIKAFIDSEIANLKVAAEKIYFEILECKFSITGERVGSSARGYYAKTENWRKTLGDFLIWLSADITYDSKNKKMKANITIHALDYYDFNLFAQDMNTGTKDSVNGRFATLGWAKGFKVSGTMKVSREWIV